MMAPNAELVKTSCGRDDSDFIEPGKQRHDAETAWFQSSVTDAVHCFRKYCFAQGTNVPCDSTTASPSPRSQ